MAFTNYQAEFDNNHQGHMLKTIASVMLVKVTVMSALGETTPTVAQISTSLAMILKPIRTNIL